MRRGSEQPSGSAAAADSDAPSPTSQLHNKQEAHTKLFYPQDSQSEPLQVTPGALLSSADAGPAGGVEHTCFLCFFNADVRRSGCLNAAYRARREEVQPSLSPLSPQQDAALGGILVRSRK